MDIFIASLRKSHTKHNLNYNLSITDFKNNTWNDMLVATLYSIILLHKVGSISKVSCLQLQR
jgi:hypothetical protein